MKKNHIVGLFLVIFLLHPPVLAGAMTVAANYLELADRPPGFTSWRIDLTITDPSHRVEVFNADWHFQDEFNTDDMFIVYNLVRIFGDPFEFAIHPLSPNPAWHASNYVFTSTPWPNSVQWTATTNNAPLGIFSFAIDMLRIPSDPLPPLAWAVHACADHRRCNIESTDLGWTPITPYPPTPSPEPGTLLLLASGLAGLAAHRAKRTNSR